MAPCARRRRCFREQTAPRESARRSRSRLHSDRLSRAPAPGARSPPPLNEQIDDPTSGSQPRRHKSTTPFHRRPGRTIRTWGSEQLWMGQMRRDVEHRGPLAERLGHQPELQSLQVSQAAVNELRVLAAGSRGEMILLNQRDTQPQRRALVAQRQIAGDAGSVDTATQDQNVERAIRNRARFVSRAISFPSSQLDQRNDPHECAQSGHHTLLRTSSTTSRG